MESGPPVRRRSMAGSGVFGMRLYMWLALALVALAATGAEARPRDDVMSRAFRCAAIGNTHQWLDCYYGAAQPARAALGLPPAPDAQQRLVQSPPGGTPADVAARDQVIAGAFRCNAMGDDRGWLNCYYGAAQPVRAVLGLAPAPQAAGMAAMAPRPAPPPMQAPAAGQFGLPAQHQAPRQGNDDHVVSRMTSYKFDRYDILTVTLENGQVWHQLDGDTNYARLKKPASSYVVEITRGFFGSYNMTVRGISGMYRMKRLR